MNAMACDEAEAWVYFHVYKFTTYAIKLMGKEKKTNKEKAQQQFDGIFCHFLLISFVKTNSFDAAHLATTLRNGLYEAVFGQ